MQHVTFIKDINDNFTKYLLLSTGNTSSVRKMGKTDAITDIHSIEYKVLGSIGINEFITYIYQNGFEDTYNQVLDICKNEDNIISFNKE